MAGLNSVISTTLIGHFKRLETEKSGIAPKIPDSGRTPSIEPFQKVFDRINSGLNGLDQRVEKNLRTVSPEARNLLRLQIDVNHLSIDTQLAVKAAETVTGTVKQLQQLGNG